MRSVPRDIAPHLLKAARAFPALVLTGPRRAGKTFCLRQTFPDAAYALLEDPDVLSRAKGDPRGFLESVEQGHKRVVLDEIQNAPDLLPYIRSRIDAAPRRTGRFVLTGSQDFALMRHVSESMAGRAAVFHMLPFSLHEIGRWDLLRGGYPEVHARPSTGAMWFRSYVQTYLERDVRAITAVQDLSTFRRFLGIVATRNGQMLNRTDLASPLGVSVPTVGNWLSILETTGIIQLVPPYFENLGKRLVKSPKLYFIDTGLLCHLLGFTTLAALAHSPMVGPVFEAFVASEIAKTQVGRGAAREIYWFRDQQGLEVDFVVPDGPGVTLIEAKWSRTITPDTARGIQTLLPRFHKTARGVVVHPAGPAREKAELPLLPGIVARTVEAHFTLK
jgi:predicted AAA+ superfamily ATPase